MWLANRFLEVLSGKRSVLDFTVLAAQGVQTQCEVRFPKLLSTLTLQYPLKEVTGVYSEPGALAESGANTIPRVVYQTWGSREFGRTHRKWLGKFRSLNPDYQFVLYDDRSMDAFMNEHYSDHEILEVYRHAKLGPLRTDIWRYCILYNRGGFYCDINKFISTPFASLAGDGVNAVISYEANLYEGRQGAIDGIQMPENNAINWALGFSKQHPLLARVIDGIVRKYPQVKGVEFSDPRLATLRFTGPIHLTECLHDYARTVGVGSETRQVGVDFGERR